MIEQLIKSLKKDKAYYYSWQANIAMAFKDEFERYTTKNDNIKLNSEDIHRIANSAAKNFLDLLCRDNKGS